MALKFMLLDLIPKQMMRECELGSKYLGDVKWLVKS